MIKATLFIVALGSTFHSFAGVSPDAKELKGVELKWSATDDINELKKIDYDHLMGKKIQVVEFTDERTVAPANKIGENTELKDTKKIVTTSTNIPQFVTSNFIITLRKVGLDVKPSEGKNTSEYVLSGSIKEYFTEETNIYRSILMVYVILKKNGKTVWSGKVVGTNKRFGRSYKLDNYMESLSDSVMDFSKEFLSNEKLSSALK